MPDNSEDINLNSNATQPTASTGDVNVIRTPIGDISEFIAPGATNEQLLTKILEAPEEKLIPWEECHLPSRGLYYNWPDGIVMVRAMGQTAEKILATQRLAQSGQSIDYLFRECCKFPGDFDAGDLLLGDRVFLLYYLRGITHGNMYEFAITCPNQNCEAVSTHTYDLNELSKTITWANQDNGQEPFKIVLPYMSRVVGREIYVGVRFLRGVDGNDILAKRKARKKMFARPGGVRNRQKSGSPISLNRQNQQTQQIDDAVSENMNKIIVHVMDIYDHFQIRQFIEKMHAQDTSTIREWLRDNTPGIDNTVTVECPECSQEFTMELPITESFFRPSKSR